MSCNKPECMGNFEFEHIACYAKKRYLDGYATIELMQNATSDLEKKEIAMASSLDISDATAEKLQLCCGCNSSCKSMDYRIRLKKIIEDEIKKKSQILQVA